MENRDYVIAFDEHGQPYIAHMSWRGVRSMASGRVSKGASSGAQGVGRGVRKVHKYLLKVGEGARAQYAYTKEEVDRLMGRGRQKVSDAASAVKKAAGNVAERGRTALSTASDKVRTSVRDFTGASARDRMTDAQNDLSTATSNRDKFRAARAYNRAKEEYGSTPLAKIESAKETASSWFKTASSTIKTHANDTLADVKGALGTAGEKIKGAADKVVSPFKGAAERTKIGAEKAAEQVKIGAEYATEKAKIEGEKLAEQARDKATQVATSAKDAYGRAKEGVKGAYEKAANAVSQSASSAKATANTTVASIKEGYNTVVSTAKDFGVDVSELTRAKTALDKAERDYKRAVSAGGGTRESGISNEAAFGAKRAYDKAIAEYNAELNDVLSYFRRNNE